MKKILLLGFKVLVVLALILTAVWFLGPKSTFAPVNPDLPVLGLRLDQLDDYIRQEESAVSGIKLENESRIIWADSVRKTEYAIVYLHGFSAGPMEGAPLHMEVAKRYGMNLYLPRLSKHGIQDDDAFADLTPQGLMESAKEALVIGKMIGQKVILMSCSTGGTLSIYLSANHPDIEALIMFSPNINLFDPTTDMLTGPWGLQIVKGILGEYRLPKEEPNIPDSIKQKLDLYWSGKYRVEGLVALQSLLDQTMTEEVFKKVNQPYFMGFYYKNDGAQDSTVSVKAMYAFDLQTATPAARKAVVAFPGAGSHVINSPLTSKSYDEVKQATFQYVEQVLGIDAVN